MKAAVMHEVGKPLSVEEVPIPEIGPEEVLVRTRSCGICGTDLHILRGFGYVPPLPHIPGHEPAGVVAKVGSNVSRLKPGDRVVPHLFFSCGECYYCRVGRHQQCANLKGLLGALSQGAFAEFFKVPAANLFLLPETIPFDVGGLVADAVVTSVHAQRNANLQPQDTAVIIGAGGIGQVLIQILKSAGVRVVGVSRSEAKLNQAKQCGAHLVVRSGEPKAAETIREFSGSNGAQCVFDCVGTAQTMREAADFVMRCGRIVVIGEERELPTINTTEIAQRELEIVGSRNGSRQDTVEAIRLLEAGIVKPAIARRFPLDEINEAFSCVSKGAAGRVVIIMGE
jgi:2-desacetyl-2-hydroxyethyl bacteriochlorophyllide A dehydrogenase